MTYRVLRHPQWYLGLVSYLSSPLSAQKPTEYKLPPANASLTTEFMRIAGIRELRDGRVLIADAGDNRLVVCDFGKGTTTQIGGVGAGPSEYGLVSELFPLAADSSTMLDQANGRWLVLSQDRIVRIVPPDVAVKVLSGIVRGVDAGGKAIVTQVSPGLFLGAPHSLGKPDSSFLVLVDTQSGRADTVTRLRIAPMQIITVRNPRGQDRVGIRSEPLSVGEEPLLFADGWVALARLDPYRVEWRTPDGRWIHSAALPFEAQRMDDKERQAYFARISKATGKPAIRNDDDKWPDLVPPFQPHPLLPLPNGDVLVARTPTASHPGVRYDRVNRSGRLVGWVELPVDQRIAGVGARGAYVIVTDDDGIQRLERHPF